MEKYSKSPTLWSASLIMLQVKEKALRKRDSRSGHLRKWRNFTHYQDYRLLIVLKKEQSIKNSIRWKSGSLKNLQILGEYQPQEQFKLQFNLGKSLMMIHLVIAMEFTKIWTLLKPNRDYGTKLRILCLNGMIKIEVNMFSNLGENTGLIVILWWVKSMLIIELISEALLSILILNW